MSTLTKVFIILLVLFSLTFTVMTVSIVAQIPDWRGTADKYAEHARVADTNLIHRFGPRIFETGTLQFDLQLGATHQENVGRLCREVEFPSGNGANAAMARDGGPQSQVDDALGPSLDRTDWLTCQLLWML